MWRSSQDSSASSKTTWKGKNPRHSLFGRKSISLKLISNFSFQHDWISWILGQILEQEKMEVEVTTLQVKWNSKGWCAQTRRDVEVTILTPELWNNQRGKLQVRQRRSVIKLWNQEWYKCRTANANLIPENMNRNTVSANTSFRNMQSCWKQPEGGEKKAWKHREIEYRIDSSGFCVVLRVFFQKGRLF